MKVRMMLRSIRTFAVRLLPGLMVLTGSCWAGPVHEGQALDGGDQAASLDFATIAAAPAASGSAATSGAARALAAEIIREIETDSHASNPRQEPKAPPLGQIGASSAGKRSVMGSYEDDLNLRDLGKTAIQWAKSRLMWLDGEAVNAETDYRAVEVGSADAPSTVSLDAMDAKSLQPTAGNRKSASRGLVDSEENLVRAALQFIREAISHPMLWLVVSLVIIGGIVAKKLDRRPTK
jgi:hypothetical protein